MGDFFASETVQTALDILKTEFPLAIWETIYVTVIATFFAIESSFLYLLITLNKVVFLFHRFAHFKKNARLLWLIDFVRFFL